MSAKFAASNQVAIVGYAHSPVEKHSAQSLGALTVDTARRAIADAGLRVDQIDGFVTGALFPSAGSHEVADGVSIVSANWLASHLGVNPRYAAGFQGFGQIPGAVALAVNAIASGAADYVVFHRALHNPKASYHGNSGTKFGGGMQWTAPQGFFGPLPMIALPYNEYLQRYNAKRESMAAVVVEARKNGARIPWSYWHDKPLSVEDYLSSPIINDPVCRYDCDIPVDGAAVFVLTSAERAKDLPHRPVHVAGYAFGQPPSTPRLPLHWPLDDIMGVGTETAKRLWSQTGLGPQDIDLPQLYDGFSPFVWFWLEVLGLCPPGQAHQFVLDGGIDSDKPGALPVLSGGGALGNGRMHGVPQMLESYLQLSGRAGDRQRERCRSRAGLPFLAASRRSRYVHRWRSLMTVANDDVSAPTAWAGRAAEDSPSVQRSRARSLERATQIVDAAHRLVVERGGEFTTNELAKEAGVAIQTFYTYFKSKDLVLLAVIEDMIVGACEHLRERGAATDHDPRCNGCGSTSSEIMRAGQQRVTWPHRVLASSRPSTGACSSCTRLNSRPPLGTSPT